MCDVHDVTTFGTLHTNQHPMLALSDQCTCHGLINRIGNARSRKKENDQKKSHCRTLRASYYPEQLKENEDGSCEVKPEVRERKKKERQRMGYRVVSV